MQVECGIVSVNFVRENLSVIFARQQDFELQGLVRLSGTDHGALSAKARADASALVRLQLWQ